MISRFQFISNNTPTHSHLSSIKMALEYGTEWVQLRIKDQPYDEVEIQAIEARKICDLYKAKLIINDYPDIARKCHADGLHLGKTDMEISSARKIVGRRMIIGGTANSSEDIERLARHQIDYIGLGPMRFTYTKKNLSPTLGIEGYKNILNTLLEKGITIPIIAIGGINTGDIQPLIELGVHGIAVSSLITESDNPGETFESIFNQIKQGEPYAYHSE